MKYFHVECSAPHGPSFEETVLADDAKAAKKLVAGHAKEKGLSPTHFTATEVPQPRVATAV